MINRRPAEGGVQAHNVGPPAKSAYRKPPADYLAQRGQIRRYSVVFLRAARRYPVADYFVKDEQRAAVGGEIPQHCQILGVAREHSHGTQHRLDDYGGQFVGMGLQDAAGDGRIVVGNDDGLVQRSRHEAAAGCHGLGVVIVAAGGRVDAQAHQHRIVSAVIAAFYFGNFAASGERPRRPDGVEGGLSAGVGEANLLEGWDAGAQQPGQLHLVAVRRVVGQAVVQLPPGRLQHRRRPVPQNHRGHCIDEVQAFHAVDVGDHRAARRCGENGVGLPKDGVPAVAVGQVAARLLPHCAGLGGSFPVAGYFIGKQDGTPLTEFDIPGPVGG